jgi:4'-phosphopantetheinyl transferase
LARYLGVGSPEISIASGLHGKPRVDGNEGVAFSLAHCDSHAAVAGNPIVGVDVEQHRPWLDLREIAKRSFAREEWELLSVLPQAEADLRFREIWTCKEAFVKAIGLGLSYSFDRFAVGAFDEGIFCLTRVEAEYGLPQAWSLFVRALEPDCSVAVAIRAPGPISLRFWGYPPNAAQTP